MGGLLGRRMETRTVPNAVECPFLRPLERSWRHARHDHEQAVQVAGALGEGRHSRGWAPDPCHSQAPFRHSRAWAPDPCHSQAPFRHSRAWAPARVTPRHRFGTAVHDPMPRLRNTAARVTDHEELVPFSCLVVTLSPGTTSILRSARRGVGPAWQLVPHATGCQRTRRAVVRRAERMLPAERQQPHPGRVSTTSDAPERFGSMPVIRGCCPCPAAGRCSRSR